MEFIGRLIKRVIQRENILTLIFIGLICLASWGWGIRNDIIFLDQNCLSSFQDTDFQMDRQSRVMTSFLDDISSNGSSISSSISSLISSSIPSPAIESIQKLLFEFDSETNLILKIPICFELLQQTDTLMTLVRAQSFFKNNRYLFQYDSIFKDLHVDLVISLKRLEANINLFNTSLKRSIYQKVALKLNINEKMAFEMPDFSSDFSSDLDFIY